jgi:hypothetical protein
MVSSIEFDCISFLSSNTIHLFVMTHFHDDSKQVLLVRTDLDMSAGKIAAQCSHACLGAYRRASSDPAALVQWESMGMSLP